MKQWVQKRPYLADETARAAMGTGLFARLDARAASELMELLLPIDFDAGDVVFAQDEPGDRIYIIVSGQVKMTCRSPIGQEQLVTVMGPSDMFGEVSIFDPGGRMYSATAVTEVRALSLGREPMQALIANHPEIVDQLLRVFARRTAQVTNVLNDIISADVPVRVATRLLQLAQRFGRRENDAVRVAHGLSAQEIAQMVGADVTTVDRVLDDFVDRGWLGVGDTTMLISDAESLAALQYVEPIHREQ